MNTAVLRRPPALPAAAKVAAVVATSLVVAFAFDHSTNRSLAFMVVGAIAVLVASPAAMLFLALLSVRTLDLPDVVAATVAASDGLLIALLVRRLWVLVSSRRLSITPANRWLILFFAWAWICTIIGNASVTPLERLSIYGAVCVVLASDHKPQKRTMYLLMTGYALFEVAVSIPSQASTRLIGVHIGDPHQLNILMFVALGVLVGGALKFRGRWLAILLLFAGVLLARSRGPIVAASVLLLLPFFGHHLTRRKIALLILGLFVAGASLYGAATKAFDLNNNSRAIREDSVQRGIRAGLSSPLFGKGWSAQLPSTAVVIPDTVGDVVGNRSDVIPYNLYVSTFAFMGVPGLVLLLLFLASALQTMLRRDRSAVLFVSAFLTLSLTEMTFYALSLGTLLFFVMCGLGQRAPTESSSQPDGRAAARIARRSPMTAGRSRK